MFGGKLEEELDTVMESKNRYCPLGSGDLDCSTPTMYKYLISASRRISTLSSIIYCRRMRVKKVSEECYEGSVVRLLQFLR